ncbi:MAG: hypothetical protein N4A45_10750 [Flavobacteriales bacterium]|jgi:hypothetical protein|nr:hypothetical protein [Flavobacteriales bacterium]
MSLNFPSYIHQELKESDVFLSQCWEQIRREIHLYFNTELEEQVNNWIEIQLCITHFFVENKIAHSSELYNFLYRVDISEKQVSEHLAKKSFTKIEEALSELLILRSAQKVYFRNHYS